MHPISIEDLTRLALQVSETEPIAWLEKNEIDVETAVVFGDAALQAVGDRLLTGESLVQIIRDTALNGLLVGWELHREYGADRP